MIRTVADTNVLISALVFGGLPGVFLDLARAGKVALVTSTSLLDELDEKLRGKFMFSASEAVAVRSALESISSVFNPDFVLHVVTDDPDDDRVLECAIAGRASYIVSGDRHLLRLAHYKSIQILNVREFLDAAVIRT